MNELLATLFTDLTGCKIHETSYRLYSFCIIYGFKKRAQIMGQGLFFSNLKKKNCDGMCLSASGVQSYLKENKDHKHHSQGNVSGNKCNKPNPVLE